MNGVIYLGIGVLVIIWPGMVQTIFRDAAFVGNEAALIRVMGMAVAVIGWLYLFGGLSGEIVAASVLDRVVLVPLVLVPLAIAGIFPHLLLAFALLDPAVGIGTWLLLSRLAALDFTQPAVRHRCSSGNRGATARSADIATKEQDAPEPGMGQQPVAERAGGEGPVGDDADGSGTRPPARSDFASAECSTNDAARGSRIRASRSEEPNTADCRAPHRA